jgi:FG-GAP repeat
MPRAWIPAVMALAAALWAAPSGAQDRRLFGNSVAASGDTMIVGVAGENTAAGVDAGAAYVYTRSGATWTEQQRLTAPDGGAGHQFGAAVAVSGDTLVVGALYGEGAPGVPSGAAYVFVRSGATWSHQQKLAPVGGAPSDWFGFFVAVSGDTAVVGAPLDSSAGVYAGAVHVFQRSGAVWGAGQELHHPAPGDGDQFGFCVSISGDTLAVGARFDDTAAGADAGSAHVFVRSGPGWALQQALVAADSAAGDWFGWAVAVDGDTAAVGANYDDNAGGENAGAVYVFTRTGPVWTELQKLTAADAQPAADFGTALAFSGTTLLIGALADDTPAAVNAGAAYVFVRPGLTWTQQQKLAPVNPTASDLMGTAVALSGDTAVVGAPKDDHPEAIDEGSAYVFVRSGTTWALQEKLPPEPARAFHLVAACRVSDTRISQAPLLANSTRAFAVAGACGVPADAAALAGNAIAVNPGEAGNLRIYAGGIAPLASAVNFAAGRTRANSAIVPLGDGGEVKVQCNMAPGSAASTHFVLDVYGYFR